MFLSYSPSSGIKYMILKFQINCTGLYVLNFVRFRKFKIYENINNKLIYMRM